MACDMPFGTSFRLRALNARKLPKSEKFSIDRSMAHLRKKERASIMKPQERESIMKPLIGYEWPEGRCKQISFISQDHHIHEFCVSNGGTWQHADLTMLASAPLAHRRFLIG